MSSTRSVPRPRCPTVIVADPAFAQEIIDVGGDWFPPGADAAFKELWGV